VVLRISPDDFFIGFLAKSAGLSQTACPTFAVLAGNPATQGRRFAVLVFDADEKPIAVVKAGVGVSARQLIEKEAAFLASVPPNAIGVPKIRDAFHSAKIDALALAFYDGDAPRTQDKQYLASLLNSWLDDQRTIPLAQTSSWQRLEKACGSNPLFLDLAKTLNTKLLHPTIYHGDLIAGGNFQVAGGQVANNVARWNGARPRAGPPRSNPGSMKHYPRIVSASITNRSTPIWWIGGGVTAISSSRMQAMWIRRSMTVVVNARIGTRFI
jgi:hypothetical protein